MAANNNRSGVSRVELAVVMIILVLLLSLLFPAIQGAREAARRSSCMKNSVCLGLAMLSYENAHRGFPGYVNRLDPETREGTILASWAMCLFPYLNRSDLWESWLNGTPQHDYLELMICPNDRPGQGGSPLSYVANCGRPGDEDTAADGIFHNHSVATNPVLVDLDYLSKHDGASFTLMFSENVQAGQWTDTEEANLGMVWRTRPEPCSSINECVDVGDRPQDLQYARPSSRHGSGVIVACCDGHQEFLNANIDYQVYQHLMTPDSKAAGIPGKYSPDSLEAKP